MSMGGDPGGGGRGGGGHVASIFLGEGMAMAVSHPIISPVIYI